MPLERLALRTRTSQYFRKVSRSLRTKVEKLLAMKITFFCFIQHYLFWKLKITTNLYLKRNIRNDLNSNIVILILTEFSGLWLILSPNSDSALSEADQQVPMAPIRQVSKIKRHNFWSFNVIFIQLNINLPFLKTNLTPGCYKEWILD